MGNRSCILGWEESVGLSWTLFSFSKFHQTWQEDSLFSTLIGPWNAGDLDVI